jgi:hypothetical protein
MGLLMRFITWQGGIKVISVITTIFARESWGLLEFLVAFSG